MNGEGGEEVEGRILEKRAQTQEVYAKVRVGYPSLPSLRDFQVAGIPASPIPHLTTMWSISGGYHSIRS